MLTTKRLFISAVSNAWAACLCVANKIFKAGYFFVFSCYDLLVFIYLRLKFRYLSLKFRYLRHQIRVLFLQSAGGKEMLQPIEHGLPPNIKVDPLKRASKDTFKGFVGSHSTTRRLVVNESIPPAGLADCDSVSKS
jgi:hypothetical protein